ncbi:GNAT family N-acetyltransferase [Roseivirga seohaensis]|uniref:GNAT family N-acetyltransferase n=1 Tax=Roseivirga seohaensis TaxID=1914963 RepID=UPI003BAB3144
MDLKKQNLYNLMSLWRLVGQKAGRYDSMKSFEISEVNNSQWPNKIWFNEDATWDIILNVANQYDLKKLTLSVWGNLVETIDQVLLTDDIQLSSTQYGMSMPLASFQKSENLVELVQVADTLSAQLWSETFEKSFAYLIHKDTIMKTMNEVNYFLGYSEGIPVGTAVLFIDEYRTAGIHSMGVIPEMRRKGFAEDILTQTLAIAHENEAKTATLQASDKGKPLYLKMGFNEDFIIKNFKK